MPPVSWLLRGRRPDGLWRLLRPFAGRPRLRPASARAMLFGVCIMVSAACGTAASVESPATTGATASVPVAPTSTPRLPEMTTVRPKALDGYVPSPYMGWQDTQGRALRFPETVEYERVNWSWLNPTEDEYDWSRIEALRAEMAGRGGAFSFRVRTMRPPPFGEGPVIPQWLVDRGAQILTNSEGISEPLYAGCLFLSAHGRFIDALRQRYDGDPDVAFIDVGSYGAFGEWWTDQYDSEPDTLDWHARRRIVDMYLGGKGTRPCLDTDGRIVQAAYNYVGFQRTQLVMPYAPWFDDSVVYALSRRKDIGIRHDALGSPAHQDRYRIEIGSLVEQIWRQAPVVFEFSRNAVTPGALRSARDFAREMHASYVHDNLDGQGADADVEAVLAVIGYRLVLKAITYTSSLHSASLLSIDAIWENTGAAPPYRMTPLVLILTDAQGHSRFLAELDTHGQTWLPGKSIRLKDELHLPATLPPGRYDLRLAFIDPDTGRASLALAIEGRDTEGRYLIGPVRIAP